ncbi:predicted protein [Sparassis crispa]|uniref:Uncharacterized protein n=1 Tax=Sparassis crispa TaxID=139825 RepID=A0A401GX27_9APHY|nr:predicted protein [Sparassis crispa]GBE86786.1 predicted protein [Sparassis crispa]
MPASAPEVYSKCLFRYKHGYPLWAPEPGDHGEILIGDVGYISRGGFKPMFNATYPKDHAVNARYTLPDDFKPLVLDLKDRYRLHQSIMANVLCSRTVKGTGVSANATVNAVGGGVQFECAEDQGAMLVLTGPAVAEWQDKSRRRIGNYIVSNCQEWVAFKGKEFTEDDFIFISGHEKTTQWAVAAITQSGRSATLSFNGNFGPATAAFSVSATRVSYPQFEYRLGPPGLEWGVNSQRGGDLAMDQSIFIHYFKMKTRFGFIKTLKAAAEPRDPSRAAEEHGEGVVAETSGTDSDDDVVEQVPSAHEPWDPVDFVLNYILKHSEAEVAVASTEDLGTLCNNYIPDDIPAFLEQTLPDIEVNEEGVGSLSLETFGLDPPASVPEQTVVQSTADVLAPAEPVTSNAEPAESGGASDPAGPSGVDIPAQELSFAPAPAEIGGSDNSAEPSGTLPSSADIPELQQSSEPSLEEGSSKPQAHGSKHVLVQTTGGVTTLACAADGVVVSGSEEGTLTLWDAESGRQLAVHEAHTDGICAIGVSPDGRALLSAGRDEVVLLWDLNPKSEGGAVVRGQLEGHEGFVDAFAWAPDGRTVVTGAVDFTARLWDVETRETTHVLRGHTAMIMWVAFSADGQRVATAAADCTARVWDVASGAELSVLRGHESVVYTVAFSPDGRRVVTGADDGTARVWRAETGEELVTLREHAGIVYHAVFSEDGKQVLSVGGEGQVKVCDSFGAEVLRSIDATAGTDDGLNIGVISRDGKLACTAASDHVVRVWDLVTGAAVAAFEGHEDSVQVLTFSPDAKRVVSSGDDGTMRIWNVEEKMVKAE